MQVFLTENHTVNRMPVFLTENRNVSRILVFLTEIAPLGIYLIFSTENALEKHVLQQFHNEMIRLSAINIMLPKYVTFATKTWLSFNTRILQEGIFKVWSSHSRA